MLKPRTNSDLVIETLQGNYDQKLQPPLAPYIRRANVFVNNVVKCNGIKDNFLSTDELLELETVVACHFYTKTDPVYMSQAQNGATGAFVRGKDEPEPYKQMAIDIDWTGCTSAIFKRAFAGMAWLGKTDAEKLSYEERN